MANISSIAKAITRADMYKYSHFLQMCPELREKGGEAVHYISPRWSEDYDFNVSFGLQIFLKRYFSHKLTKEDVDFWEIVARSAGLPFNREGFMRIVNECDGVAPLRIQAVREGTVTPIGVVTAQVRSTRRDFWWLAGFIETIFLRAIWYTSTIATNSAHLRKMIYATAVKISGKEIADMYIEFAMNDFSMRGVATAEQAENGGAAHLLSFRGSDNSEGIIPILEYYNGTLGEFYLGSVCASEHSTTTSWGEDREEEFYKHMIETATSQIVSIVADTYDLFRAVEIIYGNLLDVIKASGKKVVFRPDSGDALTIPVQVLQKIEEVLTAKGETLVINEQGYKVLPDYAGVIQGDGINFKSTHQLVQNIVNAGFAITNVVFGSGAGLLQQFDRDDLGYAMKLSAYKVDGTDEWVPVQKTVRATDTKKASFPLPQATVKRNGKIVSVPETDLRDGEVNLLEDIWVEGELLVDEDWETIRNRLIASL